MFRFNETNESFFSERPRARGFFGIGLYKPKIEINVGTLFRTAAIFGCNFMFTIGHRYKHQRSDTMKSHRHIPLFHYESFDDFKVHLPKCSSLVGVELTQNARPIRNFIHPKQAVYMLGAEDNGIDENILRQCDHVIKLPGDVSLNVSVAGSIVLYDRIGKVKEIDGSRQ